MLNSGIDRFEAESSTSDDERSWAMAAHLGTLLGSAVPFGGVMAPLVIWLCFKDRSDFVARHAKESLAFQTGVIGAVFGVALIAISSPGIGIMLLALLAVAVLLIADLVYMIRATIQASRGNDWQYPVTTRFVS